MSLLTLSQPFELLPFQSDQRIKHNSDVFLLERPTVAKVNNLYMYGNLCLLRGPRFSVVGRPSQVRRLSRTPFLSEELLAGKTLVTPLYNPEYEEMAAIPLRWGCPRIVVLHAGFKHFLGPRIDEEVSPLCRRWRYAFDSFSDLVVSPWHPEDSQANKMCRFEIVEELVNRLANCDSERILRGTIQLFPSCTE